jgi:glycosyltransferase involved in cell wall biosynthesis
MGDLRVLFLTYPRIGLNRGGLQLQIAKTAEALTGLGIEVVYYNPWLNEIPEVDLCHVFSIDGSMMYHVQSAKNRLKPVVVSPVFSCSGVPLWQTKIKAKLSSLLPGMYTDLVRARALLEGASHVIALTGNERAALEQSFQIRRDKLSIIPNGIEKRFSSASPRLFEERFGFNDFILQVGSIDRNKNQLATIRAVKGTPHKLVIIGQASTINENYYQACTAAADDNVFFLGQLSHDDPLLASAFAAAKTFILPSYNEVMPLVLYEAALAGCKLVVSQSVPVEPALRPFVTPVDPDSVGNIAAVLNAEMASPMTAGGQQVALAMPTWAGVAASIKDIYLNLLESNAH